MRLVVVYPLEIRVISGLDMNKQTTWINPQDNLKTSVQFVSLELIMFVLCDLKASN